MISATERDFIIQGINNKSRTDGRSLLTLRPLSSSKGLIQQASGSSKVTQQTTQILVGIKSTIQETPSGTVQVKIESSNFMDTMEDEKDLVLYQKVVKRMAEYMDLQKLNIIPGNSWSIQIDVLILDNGGNVLDAIVYGVRAALEDARLCKVMVESADGVYAYELGDETEPLPIENVPLCATVAVIGNELVADCTREEELCAKSTFNVLVSPGGMVCGIYKDMEGSFQPVVMKKAVDIANQLVKSMFSTL